MSNYSPLPNYLTIKQSKIHGIGIFAKADIPADHDLGITHVKDSRFQHGYIRTPLGGFVNHSDEPNCTSVQKNDTLHLKTLRKIDAGEELTDKYFMYTP